MYFSFRIWQRELLHECFIITSMIYSCSNFRCQILKEKHVYPDDDPFSTHLDVTQDAFRYRGYHGAGSAGLLATQSRVSPIRGCSAGKTLSRGGGRAGLLATSKGYSAGDNPLTRGGSARLLVRGYSAGKTL